MASINFYLDKIVDYPIKRKPNGSVVDKGCNFKLKASCLGLLFPPSQTYTLIE